MASPKRLKFFQMSVLRRQPNFPTSLNASPGASRVINDQIYQSFPNLLILLILGTLPKILTIYQTVERNFHQMLTKWVRRINIIEICIGYPRAKQLFFIQFSF